MLKPKQIKCLELMIKGNMRDGEIAKTVGIAHETLSRWKKHDEEFQSEYNKMMRSSLQYASSRAFRKQMALLNSRNDMVAHLAAKDIMDRAGFNPVEKVEQSVDMDLNISVDYGSDC